LAPSRFPVDAFSSSAFCIRFNLGSLFIKMRCFLSYLFLFFMILVPGHGLE
jgi:hypothetical protein